MASERPPETDLDRITWLLGYGDANAKRHRHLDALLNATAGRLGFVWFWYYKDGSPRRRLFFGRAHGK